jgi:hypothetical protein
MLRAFLFAFVLTLSAPLALAQNPAPQGSPVQGVPQDRSTINASVIITTGNTFQTILFGTINYKASLTIQNNNTSADNCWIFLGAGTATEAKSIILAPGQAYTRYFPYVPSDQIQVTCATTSDTLYVDTQ